MNWMQVSFKGEAEKILSICKFTSSNGEIAANTQDNKSVVMKNIEKLGETGQRFLAFAQCELDETFDKTFPPMNSTFLLKTFVSLV